MSEKSQPESGIEVKPTEAVEKDKEKKNRAEMVSETNLLIDACAYRIVMDHREAFDIELLGERYSDVLNRYEYIVGDMGFEQLRLKGFFSEDRKNMPAENRISNLEDYLYEYCNFGCPYFVLERIGEHPIKESKNRNKRTQNRGSKKPAHVNEKRQAKEREVKEKKITNRQRPVIKQKNDTHGRQPEPKKPVASKETVENKKKNRGFTIRQKNN